MNFANTVAASKAIVAMLARKPEPWTGGNKYGPGPKTGSAKN
ncbi:hypothetical protein DSM25558_4682 [Agrobacterium sp. DSM 25558]|nr:hypothetical protein DSM25558_4682 [Agrobacterium sp. DSM 25558]